MSLTLFWRCEGTTLSGTDDYTAGDTTASLINSSSITTVAARVGTNGLLKPSGFSGGATFSPSGIYPGNISSPSDGVGVIACSFKCVGSVSATANSGTSGYMRFRNSTSTNFIYLGLANTTNVCMRISGSGGSKDIETTGGVLTADAWFGVVGRFDFNNDKARIELYNSSGTLIDSAQSIGTDLSTYVLSDVNILNCGGFSSGAPDMYFDNFFVGNTYDEPVQNAFTISSYTAYASPVITDAGDEVYWEGERITVTGTGFGSTQGTGAVYISPTNDIGNADKVTQTLVSWSDTSIVFYATRGTMKYNTALYLFVKNNTGNSNSTGYSVQIEPGVTLVWTA